MTKSGSIIKYIDVNTRTTSFEMDQGDEAMDKNCDTQDMWIHFKQVRMTLKKLIILISVTLLKLLCAISPELLNY